MKTLLGIFALAGFLTFASAAERWTGGSLVQAQSSSACFQNCERAALARRPMPVVLREEGPGGGGE